MSPCSDFSLLVTILPSSSPTRKETSLNTQIKIYPNPLEYERKADLTSNISLSLFGPNELICIREAIIHISEFRNFISLEFLLSFISVSKYDLLLFLDIRWILLRKFFEESKKVTEIEESFVVELKYCDNSKSNIFKNKNNDNNNSCNNYDKSWDIWELFEKYLDNCNERIVACNEKTSRRTIPVDMLFAEISLRCLQGHYSRSWVELIDARCAVAQWLLALATPMAFKYCLKLYIDTPLLGDDLSHAWKTHVISLPPESEILNSFMDIFNTIYQSSDEITLRTQINHGFRNQVRLYSLSPIESYHLGICLRKLELLRESHQILSEVQVYYQNNNNSLRCSSKQKGKVDWGAKCRRKLHSLKKFL